MESPAWHGLARATTRRALWAAMLVLLREHFGFTAGVLGFPYEGGIPAELNGVDLPRTNVDEFRRRLTNPNPAAAFTDAHPTVKVAEISEALTPEVFEQTPLYRNVFRPQGWYYSLGFFMRRRGRFFALIAICRSRAMGNFSDADKAAAETLHPHLAAAIERIWEIECATNTTSVLARKLRGLPQAVALIDPEGRLIWCTRAAQAAAARWVAQPGTKGSLVLPEAAIKAMVRLQAATTLAPEASGPPLPPVLCRHFERPELRLQITLEPPAEPRGTPLFFVHFLEAGSDVPSTNGPRWLALLTSAERRVAEAACRGFTNPEIAAALHLSSHTVSAHLRKVYRKLDVTSRHALAARFAPEADTERSR